MVQLAHEIWHNAHNHSFEFCVPNERADSFRAEHEPNSELMHVIYASCLEEAMTKYFEWQGWEPSKPMPGVDDIPYTEEQLIQQKVCRPNL